MYEAERRSEQDKLNRSFAYALEHEHANLDL